MCARSSCVAKRLLTKPPSLSPLSLPTHPPHHHNHPPQNTHTHTHARTHKPLLLKGLSTEVKDNTDLANVASVSAGGNPEIGQLIADAMAKVGKQGVVTMEESKTAEDRCACVVWACACVCEGCGVFFFGVRLHTRPVPPLSLSLGPPPTENTHHTQRNNNTPTPPYHHHHHARARAPAWRLSRACSLTAATTRPTL